MGIGRGPVDDVVTIKVGDQYAWVENGPVVDGTSVSITAPELFGGDTGEGGIVGTLTFLFGAASQIVPGFIKDAISAVPSGDAVTYVDGVGVQDSTIVTERRADISDFKGTTTLYYSGQVCSNNPYPKTWKIRTRRALNGWGDNGCWYPAKVRLLSFVDVTRDGVTTPSAVIGMNPAHILYQCLTDPEWGLGLDRADMDDAAWTYAANALWTENFGMCIRWTKDTDIGAFIQTVIDHIGGVLYIDRGTGLMILRLIRDDYDRSLVPFFDYQSGLLSVTASETGSSLVVANEVIVNWREQNLDEDRQKRVQNPASIQSLNAVVSVTKDFPGIYDQDIATRVALRELRVGSAGLKRLTLKFDRRAWRIQPGMVIRIAAPDAGIGSMLLRVATYDDGTMIDGTITMECLQDVFGLPSTVYAAAVPGSWIPPVQSGFAPSITREFVAEANYFEMARILSAAELAAVPDTEGGVIGVAGRPTLTSKSIRMSATPTGGAPSVSTGVFSPVGVVVAPVGYYDTGLDLSAGFDLTEVTSDTAALLGDEVIKIVSFDITTGHVTIERGAADTIPEKHSTGELLFFYDGDRLARTDPFAFGEVIDVQLQNVTATAASDLVTATHEEVVIVARHMLPYAPGDVELNGSLALTDDPTAVRGDATLTWVARNRLTQFDQIVTHLDGAVTAEASTTYVVEVHDGATDALIRSHTGISASTYTYDATEAASGPDPERVDLILYTVTDGRQSLKSYRVKLAYVGDGVGIARMSGVGALHGVGEIVRWGAATMHGQGAFVGSMMAIGTAITTATMHGQGAMNGVGTVLGVAITNATVHGQGEFNGVGSWLGPSITEAAMAGTGELAATGSSIAETTGTMTGTGSTAVFDSTVATTVATMTGTGAMPATGSSLQVTTATMAGTGAMAAAGVGLSDTVATMAGVGTLAAVGTADAATVATMTGTGTLTGIAGSTGTGVATMAGAGALTGAASAIAATVATMAGTGTMAAVPIIVTSYMRPVPGGVVETTATYTKPFPDGTSA